MLLFSELVAVVAVDEEEVNAGGPDAVDEVMIDDSEFEVDEKAEDEVEEKADSDEKAEHELEQSFEFGSNQCDPIGPPELRRTANMLMMI